MGLKLERLETLTYTACMGGGEGGRGAGGVEKDEREISSQRE